MNGTRRIVPFITLCQRKGSTDENKSKTKTAGLVFVLCPHPPVFQPGRRPSWPLSTPPCRSALIPAFVLLLTAAAVAQNTTIVNSPHNLSSWGPGKIRATAETEVCIFCHTPHRASAIQPLWNRSLPVNAYTIYTSNSLKAKPGQPTGSSKLCLSCHDGTIALGNVLSRGQEVVMAGGVTTLPPGAANLGTDLSDSHPISFRYNSDLAQKNIKVKQPTALPLQTKLDRDGEVQCTTCHDPHNNRYGKFLVMDNQSSQLCKTCHVMGASDVAQHQTCAGCHKTHKAPSGPYLMVKAKVAETCGTCHGPAGPGSNVVSDLNKPSIHETHSAVNQPNPIPNNVSCADCHEPHTTKSAAGIAPSVSGRLGLIGGVNAAGAPVAAVRFSYEVCFKCHGDRTNLPSMISRRIVQSNVRLKFQTTAVSSHPIEAAGHNMDVPSLAPGWTVTSVISCLDCHNSDTGRGAGGGGPNGPHGSSYRPLLIARYEVNDNTAESASVYALCYRCHVRTTLIGQRGPFADLHKKHVVDQHAPCSICHDPHGISSTQGTATHNNHLINFNTLIAFPEPTTNRLEYNSLGRRHGSCTLKCHGKVHKNVQY